MTTLKPTAAIPPNEQVTRVEDLVFGGGDGENARCAITNRRFENGSGAQDHETQSRRFIAEAALAERKAVLEQEEAERAAAEIAAAAAPMPALRLVRAP
jgi:hypothetical protein